MFKSKEQKEYELIQEIHNEFDTAQDRLLYQAKKIISDNVGIEDEYSEIKGKAERLKRMGFKNTEDVKFVTEIKSKERSINMTKQLADRINYYMFKYPFQKFLTEGELDTICAKYDLIYSTVDTYIKTVPEKNLRDIENAKVLDKKDDGGDLHSYSGGTDKPMKNFINKHGNTFTMDEMLAIGKSYDLDNYTMDDIRDRPKHFVYQITNHNKDIFGGYTFGDYKRTHREGLFIAAPKHHFDGKKLGKKSKSGFGFFQVTEIKDPIVFRYVNGGIQVLTMWGDENFDPNQEPKLVNPINN